MIEERLLDYYSCMKSRDVLGITIHNSQNGLDAKENYDMMMKNGTNESCHFYVDDRCFIQVMPLNYGAWHTGKGYDEGNISTIAIIICQSTMDDEIYLKAQDNAIALIYELFEVFNLNENDIYFHNEFNVNEYCPHRILDIYNSKKEFIERMMRNGISIDE